MPKVKLIGSPQTQWNIGNGFLPGGTILELTEEQVENHSDVILEIINNEKINTVEKKPMTEKELFELSKDEQVTLLKELGIEKIPKLEGGRVKALLKAQEGEVRGE